MRLKSFQAKSMGEAMRQVKESLGDEAIIVSTKEEKGWVRITAAVEQTSAPPPKKQQRFDEDDISDILTELLLKHRIPSALTEKILFAGLSHAQGDPKAALAFGLKKTFRFKEPVLRKNPKPILLAGPPGAGKTLMTAKLAAQSVLDGGKPAVITTDIARAGGIEQLQAFLDIMSLPLQQADDAKTLRQELSKVKNASLVIIDTGGLNPFDPQEMKTLAKLIAVEDMDAALVLPAGGDADESAEMAMMFEVLGIDCIIPTRLDFARRIGGILSAADRTKMSFCQGSHTPQVADGLLTLTPESLADFLMPQTPTVPKRGKK